jgi:hypothetical protein
MCTGAGVLHTECGWERGEVGTALARDEQNLPMNEKPTRLFVVDRPTFSWEIAEKTIGRFRAAECLLGITQRNHRGISSIAASNYALPAHATWQWGRRR